MGVEFAFKLARLSCLGESAAFFSPFQGGVLLGLRPGCFQKWFSCPPGGVVGAGPAARPFSAARAL